MSDSGIRSGKLQQICFTGEHSMKMKRRIAVGAAAMAAAVTLGSCKSGAQTGQSSTQIESTSEAASQDTSEGTYQGTSEQSSSDTSEESSQGISGKTGENSMTESSAQSAEKDTSESAAVGITEISAESITEIDVFVEEHNYNPVVYGPPEDR